jgi:hypothetical protein
MSALLAILAALAFLAFAGLSARALLWIVFQSATAPRPRLSATIGLVSLIVAIALGIARAVINFT